MIKEMQSRRSIRRYLADRPVEDEKIKEIIESARIAPSGSNTQPWHYILVQSDEMRKKLAIASHNQTWMASAPLYIVCVADSLSRLEDNTDVVYDEYSPNPELKQLIRDTSIGITHMLLSAENLGLGSCWIAWFTQEDIRPLLNIPKDKYVVGILTLGYADEAPAARPRKSAESFIHHECW